jgi:peptidoglycan/xylan/chitin deacetylase (PgdA/CDA1 family)
VSLRSFVKHRLATSFLPRTDRDAVLLTFDDGPHPEGTPAVLEVLRRHAARAVFFVVGSRVHRAPAMLKRIVDEGHVIGNHSFAHPLGRQFGLVRYRHDVEECQAIVERWAGCRPALFRPPLGHLSFASLIAPRLVGLSPLLWSVDSDDWELRASSDVPVAAARLLQKLSGRPLHDIVLFHDEKRLTAELLQSILPVLASRSVDLRPSIGQIG